MKLDECSLVPATSVWLSRSIWSASRKQSSASCRNPDLSVGFASSSARALNCAALNRYSSARVIGDLRVGCRMLLVDDFHNLTGGRVDEDKLVIDVEVFQRPGRWNLDVDALRQRGE